MPATDFSRIRNFLLHCKRKLRSLVPRASGLAWRGFLRRIRSDFSCAGRSMPLRRRRPIAAPETDCVRPIEKYESRASVFLPAMYNTGRRSPVDRMRRFVTNRAEGGLDHWSKLRLPRLAASQQARGSVLAGTGLDKGVQEVIRRPWIDRRHARFDCRVGTFLRRTDFICSCSCLRRPAQDPGVIWRIEMASRTRRTPTSPRSLLQADRHPVTHCATQS